METENNMSYMAVYYERVSTIDPSQDESMVNQRKLLESYLARHTEIKLAEPPDKYSERVSGKSDERPKFKEMLNRLAQGDISYVLVKDLKRLSRSTEVSAILQRLSADYNFKFILLSTGQVIDPNRNDTRLLYGFESLINEQVVFRQSEYGRIAHRQKLIQKRLNRNNITFGYSWDAEKETIVINEEQAKIIRKVFDMYVFEGKKLKDIQRFLYGEGYSYTCNGINNWLKETAYIGVFHLNKKGSELRVGSGQHTHRYTNPVSEWVAVERPELRIVDDDIFNLARKIREHRRHEFSPGENGVKQARFSGTHMFSRKLFCGDCGGTFYYKYADRAKKLPIYRDRGYTRRDDIMRSCSNKSFYRIYESDLQKITANIINKAIQDNPDTINHLIMTIRKVFNQMKSTGDDVSEKEKKLRRLDTRLKNLEEAYISAEGDLRISLQQKYNDLSEQRNQMAKYISDQEKYNKDLDQHEKVMEDRLSAIREVLGKEIHVYPNDVNSKIVDIFIQRMNLYGSGLMEVILNTNRITCSSFHGKGECAEKNIQVSSREQNREDATDVCVKNFSAVHFSDILETQAIDNIDYLDWFSFTADIREKKQISVVVKLSL